MIEEKFVGPAPVSSLGIKHLILATQHTLNNEPREAKEPSTFQKSLASERLPKRVQKDIANPFCFCKTRI